LAFIEIFFFKSLTLVFCHFTVGISSIGKVFNGREISDGRLVLFLSQIEQTSK